MNRHPHASGFTLVETMVAISVLLVAIAAPLLTAERAAAAAYAARDEITAASLVQEGAEYVRAMRDDTYLHDYHANSADPRLSADAWNDFLNGALTSSITTCRTRICTLDPSQSMGIGAGASINTCSGICAPLYLSSSGIYNQQSVGTKTTFTRSFTVTNNTSATDSLGNPLGISVKTTVSWVTDGVPYSMSISNNLTPWQ